MKKGDNLQNLKPKKGHKSKTIKYDSERAVRMALLEFAIYMCFLIVATIVCLNVRHLYMFYFNHTVDNLFLNRDTTTLNGVNLAFSQLVTTSDWWTFLQQNFLDDLHGLEYEKINTREETGKGKTEDEEEEKVEEKDEEKEETVKTANETRKFLNENLLLGPPRLRQIRVLPGSCHIHEVFSRYFNSCYSEYSRSIEDIRSQYKGTKFYTLEELSTNSLWGQIGTYIGGGYVKYLTYDANKNKVILEELKASHWIDRGTRVVLVEFGMFNANTDLFDNVKFIAELPPTGGIIPSSQLQALKLESLWYQSDWGILLAAIIFYLFIVYYTVEEVRDVIRAGLRTYFLSIWNLVDLTIIFLAYVAFFYNFWHSYYLRKLLERVSNNPEIYQSLDIICYWNKIYIDLMAICIFMVWIKIFKFISFNKTMLQFSTTLKRCAKDILGFAVMFSIVFVAYAQLGLLLFGAVHSDFRNFRESALTMMRMVLGDFEYSALEKANRVLGPIYFLTYILLVFFILLNMFLAIINETYSTVKSEITHGGNHLQIYLAKICNQLSNLMWKKHRLKSKFEDKETPSEVISSEPLLDPRTSITMGMTAITASEKLEEPVRLRESYILKEYFEEVPPPGEPAGPESPVSTVPSAYPESPVPSSQDNEQIKRLTTRVSLLEDVLEQLINNMDRILQKVEDKKKSA